MSQKKAAPEKAAPLDTAGLATQRAASSPSALSHDKPAQTSSQEQKSCVTCGQAFVPNRSRFRKCLGCARAFKAAQYELVKLRIADGVVAFQLRQFLPLLRSDDTAAAQWLNDLRDGAEVKL